MNRPTSTRFLQYGFTLFLTVSPATAGIVVLSGSGFVWTDDDDGGDFEEIPWTQVGTTGLSAQWRELDARAWMEFSADNNSVSVSFSGSHSVRRTAQATGTSMDSGIGVGFWIISDVDVIVSATGTMNYSLHGEKEPTATMFFFVENNDVGLIHQGSVYSTYDPPDGAIYLADSVVLDGGIPYSIVAASELGQLAIGFSEMPSVATSELTLKIQAIPEPATLVLLGIACGIVMRRESA